MKIAGILIWMCFVCCAASAWSQPPSIKQPRDSALLIGTDSLKSIAKTDSIISSDSIYATSVQGDPMRRKVDSVITATSSDALFAPAYLFKPSPRKAVIYSAIFPGLGQIYNRKYWKLPILYGGFVGFTYAISWNNGYYRDYLGAYQDIMDDNPDTNRWHNLLPYGQDPGTTDIQWFTDVLQQRKDYYRYYRDLSIIGTVALYFVAMVDAYVDAQLFDFDISPDLSMRVEPAVLKTEQPRIKGNSAYGIQWSFSF
ncbi:MAG: DUF5683 domain-containing protein [Porphyromonadaceae bacterium]|nr:DUF5683 domain-containing protein [Porphyromonadaceae bacterium]